MSGDDDEFRFGPADVGPAGDGDAAAEFDPVPAVIGLAVGIGGLLFLAEPFVDPLAVGGTRLPVVFLSVIVVAIGLLFGGAAYLRRGRRRIGLAHAVGGAGWALVAVGTALGSGVVLFAGLAVLLGGCLWLVAGLVAAG